MPPETIIEFTPAEGEWWSVAPIGGIYGNHPVIQRLIAEPLGTEIKHVGLTGWEFRWRKVPTDPLLKEIVLANSKHGA